MKLRKGRKLCMDSLWYDKHWSGKIKIINVKEYKLEDIQPQLG